MSLLENIPLEFDRSLAKRPVHIFLITWSTSERFKSSRQATSVSVQNCKQVQRTTEYVSWCFRLVSSLWLSSIQGYRPFELREHRQSMCTVRSADGGINYAANLGPVQCSPVHRPINSENIHEPRNPSGRCVTPEGGQRRERCGATPCAADTSSLFKWKSHYANKRL